MKDNKRGKIQQKDFFKYVNSKKETKVAMGSQLTPNETILTDNGGKSKETQLLFCLSLHPKEMVN